MDIELSEQDDFLSLTTTRSDHGANANIKQHHWRDVLEMTPCPIFFVSPHDTKILNANQAASDFIQVPRKMLLGTRLLDFVPEREYLDAKRLLQQLRSDEQESAAIIISAGDGVGVARLRLKKIDEVVVAVDQTEPIHFAANSGADVDPLTGLMNRRSLEKRIQSAIDGREDNWGVLFIDLNDYKRVNDLYGHIVGDKVLADFAGKLVACSRPGDLVSRFGGDEFVMFADRMPSQSDLRNMAHRISTEVQVVVPFSDPPIVVTASTGCAMANAELSSWDQIITAADRDMYRMKRHPR